MLLLQALLYFLVLLGYNEHFAPSICMSAFPIKIQQHNEEAQMNMSVSKSILPPTCSECLLIPTKFCPELKNRQLLLVPYISVYWTTNHTDWTALEIISPVITLIVTYVAPSQIGPRSLAHLH